MADDHPMVTSAAELVDSAVSAPVLVYGSLPPEGRDLDLFVRPAEHEVLTRALAEAGYERLARSCVRLGAGPPSAVDLRLPSSWGLPVDEVQALFADARPFAGWAHLVRPSPHHAVLLLARRVAAGDGTLDDKRRARLEQALAEDPAAWDRAAAHATAWGANSALAVLRRAHAGRPVRRPSLAAARAERAVAGGAAPPLAWARAWRSVLRPAVGGAVVAVCGLDGAGKSSQASDLAACLEQLGRPAVTQWTRLSYDPALDVLARPVKRLLRLVHRDPVAPAAPDVHQSRLATPEQRIRQRSRTMTAVWVTVVAVRNGLAQRRSSREHLAAGRIIVCDRWTLDSAVHLRYRYGESRRFNFQVRLIRLLSPSPLRTFFLDIPAETAYARKHDHYDVTQLQRQQRLYREEHPRHAAHRLDGTRPREELSGEIARSVLSALDSRPRRWAAAARSRRERARDRATAVPTR